MKYLSILTTIGIIVSIITVALLYKYIERKREHKRHYLQSILVNLKQK